MDSSGEIIRAEIKRIYKNEINSMFLSIIKDNKWINFLYKNIYIFKDRQILFIKNKF